jgi:hypothetical protein
MPGKRIACENRLPNSLVNFKSLIARFQSSGALPAHLAAVVSARYLECRISVSCHAIPGTSLADLSDGYGAQEFPNPRGVQIRTGVCYLGTATRFGLDVFPSLSEYLARVLTNPQLLRLTLRAPLSLGPF